jgi:hypothetical protein
LNRPSIFISYSHKDEDWKDRILVHIGIAQKQELFDVWDDRRIEGCKDWFEAIGLTKNDEVTETKIDLNLAKIAEEIDALTKVKLLGEARKGWAAIKYESGVQ